MSSAVEDFVNHVQSLSSQGQFSLLCDYMNKSWNNLTKINVTLLDSILEALDLQEHSLGIMYVLCIKVNAITSQTPAEDFEQILSQLSLFLSQCTTEQIRYSSGNFAQIFHKVTDELCSRGIALRGIKLVSMAIQKLQLHSSQLTSIHGDLCQLCLDARCLKPSLKFLNIEITDIAKENGLFDAKHFLNYYYYGGLIYACEKKYSRSLYFFEQAISCPASTVSFIMLEAYKKYCLISLIVADKFIALPKYTSQVITRFIKPFTVEYNELVQAYASNDPVKLNAVVSDHQSVFLSDNNVGLIKQVAVSLNKRNIKRLTKTFITLSLSDVAVRARISDVGEVETQLMEMIEKNEIFATINKENQMVYFHDDPEQYNSSSMLQKMDRDIQNFIELDRKMREMSETIQVNPTYLQKVKNVSSQDDEFDGGLLGSASSSSSRSSLLSKLVFK